MRRAALLAVAGLLAAAPPAAGKIVPFDHPCTFQDGVQFCPTQNDSQRVRSFDGVPLDVDVTFPASGSLPFPTIVMLHGFPGTKESFESPTPAGVSDPVTFHYNNNFFAKRGYAVVNYSARGFGRSCGVPSSRGSHACDRGWFHLADQRYELRDAQFLVGKLVDQGLVDPKRIGVTGVSYGGGSSLQLAYLRDRIRLRDGRLVPWVSPAGTRLHVAAAYPRWSWSDLAYSLVPNGRFLASGGGGGSATPVGVAKESIVNALYQGGVAIGYLAPKGSDRTADLATWRERAFRGEPYGAKVRAIVDQFVKFKSATGIPGAPAPLLIMDGWTDPAFNALEALRTYNRVRSSGRGWIRLQLGDLGHFRAGNALAMYKDFSAEGAAFLDRFVKRTPSQAGSLRPSGGVTAYGQGCPKGTLGPGPIRVPSFGDLARGAIRLDLNGTRRVTEGGGDSAVGDFFNPVTNGDPCSTTAATRAPGTAVLTRSSKGFTLAGPSTIEATIENGGAYQIDARLFDVSGGRERLIDYGVYRLKPGQSGTITFQTAGNLYRFPNGHVVKLELLGRNEPWFLRDPSGQVLVSGARAWLPTREPTRADWGGG